MEGDNSESKAHIDDTLDNGDSFKSGELSSPSDSESLAHVYQGVVYHVGVNAVGHQFVHRRYLRIHGKHVEMFKKDPATGAKPIRHGVAGQFLKIEDLGRRKIDNTDYYVLKICNSLDDTRMGEIACMTASDAQHWRNAFQQAMDEADFRTRKGSGHKLMDEKDEFKLTGHRPRLRRYAKGLTKLITIGRGPEFLFGRDTKSSSDSSADTYGSKHEDFAVDESDWRCVSSVNGIRILEDISVGTKENIVIMKSEGVIEASPSSVFEMLIHLHNPHRKEWDILTGDLKLIETVDGHCDIVYGTFDPKYLKRWNSKRDFVFSRVWRHDPDNTYSIMQQSTSHKKCPKKSGFRRITLNTSVWEIKPLLSSRPDCPRSLVTQTMEIKSTGWGPWRKKYYSQLDKTIPYVILCQVAGLRDYFASNPNIHADVSTTTMSKHMDAIGLPLESSEISDVQEQFYDALAANVEEDDDSDEDEQNYKKSASHKFRSTTYGIMLLKRQARAEGGELDSGHEPVEINMNKYKGSLCQAVGNTNSNCWTDPGGKGFMVRGKTYSSDGLKVPGGDPLLKLLAVDWLTSEKRIDSVATNPKYLVQSEEAKQLPFILVINLQVPGSKNYSLVFYFGADRPIRKGSLLDRFANGDDAFRDSRLKLIPRIVEGYWFVKRAVGTKACLLGKAVTCSYVRQDNFLEIDVDIGSSSVARNIINLVLGHVTSIVVDIVILIEGRKENELPEYLMGATRVNHVELESAIPY